MEKYYDLIVELVKAHRKYAEYASILDDIVEDVCAQAKTVIDTVNDENIVRSYLERIVSTSMITVPKRLGITKVRQTSVVLPDPIEEIAPEEEDDDDLINDYVEETIEESPFEPSAIDNNDIEANIDNNNVSITDDIEVNKDLVDKMINGVSSEDAVNTDANETIEPGSDDLELNFDVDIDNELVVEESSPEETTVNQLSEEPIEQTVDEDVETDFSIQEEPAQDDTSALLDTLYPAEEPLQADVDEDTSMQISDSIEPIETDDFMLETEDIDLLEETVSEQFTVEEEAYTLDQDSNDETDKKADEFTPPSYKTFNFTPNIDNSDLDKIMSEIKELDAKNPDKCILSICNAKYKDCKSVSEISEELNISVDSVIEALNEIIYLVKD